jgi:hypothetical protein
MSQLKVLLDSWEALRDATKGLAKVLADPHWIRNTTIEERKTLDQALKILSKFRE